MAAVALHRRLRLACLAIALAVLHTVVPAQPANPRWSELNPAQQQALAPLAQEWDRMDAGRKGKWLAIGNRYASMKPEEQSRMQERMRDWVELSPEQRRQARERYTQARRIDPGRKSAQWEQYQQLPQEQRQKLAEENARRKRVTTLPPPASQPRPLPPIKGSPRPVLEQSVTPGAAGNFALRPSSQPGKQGQP